MEIFQLGNSSSQAIKCFTQTRSLTTLGPPAPYPTLPDLPHIKSRQVTTSIKKSYTLPQSVLSTPTAQHHKEKQGLSPFPSGRGFNQQKSHITAKAEMGSAQEKVPRGPVTEEDLQESSLLTSCRALPRVSGSPCFPAVAIVFPIFEGFGIWGTPSTFALDPVQSILTHCFSSWFHIKSWGAPWGVREGWAKSSFTFVVYGWQEDLCGISNWPKPS